MNAWKGSKGLTGDATGSITQPLRQKSLHTFFRQASQNKAEVNCETGYAASNIISIGMITEERALVGSGLTISCKRPLEIASTDERSGKIAKLEVHEQNDQVPTSGDGYISRLHKVDDLKSEVHGSSRVVQGAINESTLEKTKSVEKGVDGGTSWTTTGIGRRVPAPIQVDGSTLTEDEENELTQYEKERLENVRRNQLFLQNLGIFTTKESLQQTAAKTKKNVKKFTPKPVMPLRRSLRRRGLSPEIHNQTDKEQVEDIEDESDEAKDVFFDDSSVKKYMCNGGVVPSNRNDTCSIDWSEVMGYQSLSGQLSDSSLTRIYSMDITTPTNGPKGLLAAGGHRGQVAVFGVKLDWELSSQAAGGNSGVSTSGGDDGEMTLLSWKAASGWISQVQFLSQQRQDAGLLLSSSNDGSLILWDLKKQQSGSNGHRNFPQALVKQSSLHSSGIFAMHELNGRIVTGSKDFSLACSIITESSIIKENVISGHHTGGIRGVRFRDVNVLADCGADGRICILDLRLRNACVTTINSLHKSPVNVVEWSPMQDSLLLSASNDPDLHLYDIRKFESSILSMVGHVKPTISRCRKIYRPSFVGDGSRIITPGEGSKMLTLYSTRTGKVLSRGLLGFDPSLVMGSSRTWGLRKNIWAAGSHIVRLAPMTGDSCTSK